MKWKKLTRVRCILLVIHSCHSVIQQTFAKHLPGAKQGLPVREDCVLCFTPFEFQGAALLAWEKHGFPIWKWGQPCSLVLKKKNTMHQRPFNAWNSFKNNFKQKKLYAIITVERLRKANVLYNRIERYNNFFHVKENWEIEKKSF